MGLFLIALFVVHTTWGPMSPPTQAGFARTWLQDAVRADARSWRGHRDSREFPKRALLSHQSEGMMKSEGLFKNT